VVVPEEEVVLEEEAVVQEDGAVDQAEVVRPMEVVALEVLAKILHQEKEIKLTAVLRN